MPLFATCAVFAGLQLTGIELNITAMMGMTMIIGIVTEVAIFFFSEFTTCGHPEPPSSRPSSWQAATACAQSP
jgi:predicted exporter